MMLKIDPGTLKWLCKILGHPWFTPKGLAGEWHCKRCEEVKLAIEWPHSPNKPTQLPPSLVGTPIPR